MKCYYCRTTLAASSLNIPESKTREHLVARSNGGKHIKGNVVNACRKCNQLVGNWSVRKKQLFKHFIQLFGWEYLDKIRKPRNVLNSFFIRIIQDEKSRIKKTQRIILEKKNKKAKKL